MITEFLKEYLPRETSNLLTPLALKDIMDPRQPPQHPFSRNTASPYGRTPFPPAQTQNSFPPTSQPPSGPAPSYIEHARRPSEPPYYSQPRYGPEGSSMSGPGHSRHQSASSVGHATPVNRMPPPSSPQQPSQQAPHHNYGLPPRAPPVSLGPPSSFPSSRELPTLPPLGGRPASNGVSSMSISSMLGGGPPVSREAPPAQYASPVVTSAPSNAMFGSTHASPRLNTTASDYAPYRRPQTPEHQRAFQTRDHRANSAGSPPNPGHYSTPESQRFGTPQQAYQRPPLAEERREPIRGPPSSGAMPPRPTSQPATFSGPPPRVPENPRPPTLSDSIFGRRVETAPGPGDRREPSYGRPAFEERHNLYGGFLERAERERQQERARDAAIIRDREMQIQRDREQQQEQRERAAEHESNLQREYAHQQAQRNAQIGYSRPPDPREHHPQWMRPGYEHTRPPYEQQPPERPPPQQPSNGYEYPASSGPQYGGHPAYAPNEQRYEPAPPASTMPPQHNPTPATQYEASILLQQQRLAQQHEQQRQQLQQQQQSIFNRPPPQNGQYQNHESPVRRPLEEPHSMQQQSRNSLAVQEINRRGRISPLPQPVQGAQGQNNGQSGEPSIKNEFGRMFAGIGSGAGAMERAMSGQGPNMSGHQIPFSNPGQLRREDLEGMQDSPGENGGLKIARTSSHGGRRRKLKEEDNKADDESSNGRQTPSGRGKRAKIHHHHHHHHHHRAETQDNVSSPMQSNLTPFKSVKGSAIPSPPNLDPYNTGTLHHHHAPQQHYHRNPAKAAPQANTIIPLPKTIIRNKAVLEAVSNLPRRHLGHGYYKSVLKPISTRPKRDFSSERGFASTPEPLPRFEGNENCTFTIRVPRVYLTQQSREEVTHRRAVWGVDVYTDDSDIIAACIHQGWFRGAWPEDVDISLLDLDKNFDTDSKGLLDPPHALDDPDLVTSPPAGGPMEVPEKRDLHVTVLVLPTLEQYYSKTRFGIMSREWGGKHDGYKSLHDGLSFMIQSIKWVSGVDGEESRSGSGRKETTHLRLGAIDLGDEATFRPRGYAADDSFDIPMPDAGTNEVFQESFVRGGGNGDIVGIGGKSWWLKSLDEVNGKASKPKAKPKPKPKPKDKPVEKAKVNVPKIVQPPPPQVGNLSPKAPPMEILVNGRVVGIEESGRARDMGEEEERRYEIQRVMERMVVNAHTADGTKRDPDVPIPSVEKGPAA